MNIGDMLIYRCWRCKVVGNRGNRIYTIRRKGGIEMDVELFNENGNPLFVPIKDNSLKFRTIIVNKKNGQVEINYHKEWGFVRAFLQGYGIGANIPQLKKFKEDNPRGGRYDMFFDNIHIKIEELF